MTILDISEGPINAKRLVSKQHPGCAQLARYEQQGSIFISCL